MHQWKVLWVSAASVLTKEGRCQDVHVLNVSVHLRTRTYQNASLCASMHPKVANKPSYSVHRFLGKLRRVVHTTGPARRVYTIGISRSPAFNAHCESVTHLQQRECAASGPLVLTYAINLQHSNIGQNDQTKSKTKMAIIFSEMSNEDLFETYVLEVAHG